ncbi:MAG TPA: GntR family transcriptional regulator [Gemmatimonadales bacterium]|jgi:DNA-binding GntR family transcriptional regulator
MITRAPLRDDVSREIVQLVHSGELAPGSKVRDVALAERLGVSRTPVREALLRLSRDGALEALPGRGFRVRPLDPGEIRDVGTILSTLEPLALRLSPDIPRERLDRLSALDRRMETTRGDPAASIDLHDDWHRILLEGCPNPRLLQMTATLRQTPRRYLHAYMRQTGGVSLSTGQHAKMLEALGRDERESAIRHLEQHWRRGTEELEAWTKTAVSSEQ